MTIIQFAVPLQICKSCYKRLPLTDEYWYKSHQKPGTYCKSCVKEKVYIRRAQKLAQKVANG